MTDCKSTCVLNLRSGGGSAKIIILAMPLKLETTHDGALHPSSSEASPRRQSAVVHGIGRSLLQYNRNWPCSSQSVAYFHRETRSVPSFLFFTIVTRDRLRSASVVVFHDVVWQPIISHIRLDNVLCKQLLVTDRPFVRSSWDWSFQWNINEISIMVIKLFQIV